MKKITFGRAMRGYTTTYGDANQVSKHQTLKKIQPRDFPPTQLESSAKAHNNCKAIAKFGAYP